MEKRIMQLLLKIALFIGALFVQQLHAAIKVALLNEQYLIKSHYSLKRYSENSLKSMLQAAAQEEGVEIQIIDNPQEDQLQQYPIVIQVYMHTTGGGFDWHQAANEFRNGGNPILLIVPKASGIGPEESDGPYAQHIIAVSWLKEMNWKDYSNEEVIKEEFKKALRNVRSQQKTVAQAGVMVQDNALLEQLHRELLLLGM